MQNDCLDKVSADLAIPHPFYDHVYYDVALVRLERRVRFTEKVYPVCLPSEPLKESGGDMLSIIGWGKERGNHTRLSRVLKEVNKCRRLL